MPQSYTVSPAVSSLCSEGWPQSPPGPCCSCSTGSSWRHFAVEALCLAPSPQMPSSWPSSCFCRKSSWSRARCNSSRPGSHTWTKVDHFKPSHLAASSALVSLVLIETFLVGLSACFGLCSYFGLSGLALDVGLARSPATPKLC